MNEFDDFYQMKAVNALVPEMRYSLCVNNRKILIDKEIDENLIVEWLYYINKLLDLDKISGTKEPIEFIISSCGGSVYDGLTLVGQIEYLKSLGYKIITTNASKAFSMGFILSILGTERRAYEYSSYMIHDVSSLTVGKLKTMEEDIIEVKRLRTILNNIIIKYTKISESDLLDWQNKKIDKFISAEDAFLLGIVDIILKY